MRSGLANARRVVVNGCFLLTVLKAPFIGLSHSTAGGSSSAPFVTQRNRTKETNSEVELGKVYLMHLVVGQAALQDASFHLQEQLG